MGDYDEYGLKKPHRSWTEAAVNLVAPDPEAPTSFWDIPRALAAAPLALGGHFMDSLPGINGGPLPGPFAEIEHGVQVNEYQRRRSEIEGPPPGPPYLPSETTPDYSELPQDGECNPDGVPFFLERPPEPTYQWMAD